MEKLFCRKLFYHGFEKSFTYFSHCFFMSWLWSDNKFSHFARFEKVKMLTPRFSIDQKEQLLLIQIKAPYTKVSNVLFYNCKKQQPPGSYIYV